MNRRKVNLKQKKRSKQQAPVRAVHLAPPSFQATPVKYMKIRGQTTAAFATRGYNVQQLASYCVGIVPQAAGAANTVHLAASFKIKRISIWGPVATAGTPVTVELRFPGTGAADGTTSPQVDASDSSVSFDRPAYATLKPKKTSLHGQWFNPTTTGFNFVEITGPQGSIIDIDFDFVLNEDGAPFAGAALGAGGGTTIGGVFHLTLPGTLVPTNLNTTT